MKRHSDLHLLSATCRLAPGDADIEAAARQWEDVFGVVRGERKGESEFANARLQFVSGVTGESGGLVEMCVGVEGNIALSGVLDRAERMGVLGGDGVVEMLGVRWKFVLFEEEQVKSRL